MSRSVRIRGDIAARVEALAASERRPFANAVEVLLLAALDGREREALVRIAGTPTKSSPVESKEMAREAMAALSPADVAATVPGVDEEAAMIADTGRRAKALASRDGKCRADVAFGTKCKLCGKVH